MASNYRQNKVYAFSSVFPALHSCGNGTLECFRLHIDIFPRGKQGASGYMYSLTLCVDVGVCYRSQKEKERTEMVKATNGTWKRTIGGERILTTSTSISYDPAGPVTDCELRNPRLHRSVLLRSDAPCLRNFDSLWRPWLG